MCQCRQNTTGCDCDTHYTNQSWSPQNHLPSHNSRTFWSLDLKQQYRGSGGSRSTRRRGIDWFYLSWLQLPSDAILQLCKAIYVAVDSESMCTQFSIPKVQTVEKASFLGSICAVCDTLCSQKTECICTNKVFGFSVSCFSIIPKNTY